MIDVPIDTSRFDWVFHPRFRALNFAARAVAQGSPMGGRWLEGHPRLFLNRETGI